MKYIKVLLCLVTLFLINTSYIEAATTFKGKSGLINIPSAYVPRAGHGGVGFFGDSDGESIAGNISLPGGVEFAYSQWRPDHGKKADLFSIKYALVNEAVLKPAISVGIEDIGDKFDRSFYLVTSKQMPFGLRLHMGLKSGDESNGLFYGLEKQIRLNNKLPDKNSFIPVLNIMLEYDGQNFNYGFFVRNKHGLRFDIAWHDDKFRAGVQFEF